MRHDSERARELAEKDENESAKYTAIFEGKVVKRISFKHANGIDSATFDSVEIEFSDGTLLLSRGKNKRPGNHIYRIDTSSGLRYHLYQEQCPCGQTHIVCKDRSLLAEYQHGYDCPNGSGLLRLKSFGWKEAAERPKDSIPTSPPPESGWYLK